MAEITINYTVAATRTEPQIDVQLFLTYDETKPLRDGGYRVTDATGSYTVTNTNGVVTGNVELSKPHRLGNNDNAVYPTGTNIVDRHGITFKYTYTPIGRMHEQTRPVNFFYNPRRAVKGYQQYTNYKSRDAILPHEDGEPKVESFSAAANDVTLCFAAGTMIRTLRGEVAVEALTVGDIAVTATGALRPIRWLGHRTIDLSRHPRSGEVGPVRIAANAFGPMMPSRDLFLSPGHPVLVGADADHDGGHLVPIMCLVNGTTIERVSKPSVTYWHVELDEHDILLADGLPAESYLELGDRAFFTDETASALMGPDFVVPGIDGRCRPVAVDGVIVEAERDRLDTVFGMRLAEACGWPSNAAAPDF